MLRFHDLGKWRTNTETSEVTHPTASASKSKGAVLKKYQYVLSSKYTLYTHSCKIAFILENKRKAMISVSYSDRQLYFSGNAIFQETDSGCKPEGSEEVRSVSPVQREKKKKSRKKKK